MNDNNFSLLFDKTACSKMLPPEKTDEFFEALFGDASEGSYDIELMFDGCDDKSLRFNIALHQRPGHCLACNLTQGLPQVFSRHPVIDVAGIVEQVDVLLEDKGHAGKWQLGFTQQRSQALHIIPLTIELA
jgi:hypothetical protein